MYGYKTRHRILDTIIKWQVRNPENINRRINFDEFFKIIGGTADEFGKAVVYLEREGYLKYVNIENKEDKRVFIDITPKGTSAAMDSYFLMKHDEIFYRRLADLGIVVFNGIIALVAIIALNRSNAGDLRRIEERILRLEQAKEMQTQPPLQKMMPIKSNNTTSEKNYEDSAKH